MLAPCHETTSTGTADGARSCGQRTNASEGVRLVGGLKRAPRPYSAWHGPERHTHTRITSKVNIHIALDFGNRHTPVNNVRRLMVQRGYEVMAARSLQHSCQACLLGAVTKLHAASHWAHNHGALALVTARTHRQVGDSFRHRRGDNLTSRK